MSFDGNPFSAPQIQSNGAVTFGNDKQLLVEFIKKPVYMEAQSIDSGRPVYEDKDYVKIQVMGLNGASFERPVKLVDDGGEPPDPERFPRQWQAFQRQQVQTQDGTPLEEVSCPWLTKSVVLMAKSQNVHTVEAAAGLSDNDIGLLGLHGRKIRDWSKNYVQQSKDGTALSQLTSENETLKRDLKSLKEAVTELKGEDVSKMAQELAALRAENAQIKAAQSAPKKRGPKPKQKENHANQI